jgi:hypothetical protein
LGCGSAFSPILLEELGRSSSAPVMPLNLVRLLSQLILILNQMKYLSPFLLRRDIIAHRRKNPQQSEKIADYGPRIGASSLSIDD